MSCPICGHSDFTNLLSLDCSGFDQSLLYNQIIIDICDFCGHIFNRLTPDERKHLVPFYEEEYALCNVHSPNADGDLPGSSNKNSLVRYLNLYEFTRPYMNENSNILDVGCAMGGYITYLKTNGYRNVFGIDIPVAFVESAAKKGLNVKVGSAERIPYATNLFDLVVADQVVEHLVDPNVIFVEAKRVLKHNGILCISVPNALLYNKPFIFDFFWFLSKEHIHHFDSEHLAAIAIKHGFSLLATNESSSDMASTRTPLPTLSMLFRLSNNTEAPAPSFMLKDAISEFIKRSYTGLDQKRYLINEIMTGPLIIYGISKEFFYLYNNTNLNKCHIIGLIDDTIFKQQLLTFRGHKIQERLAVLKYPNPTLLITAIAHTDTIKRKLDDIHFGGKIIAL